MDRTVLAIARNSSLRRTCRIGSNDDNKAQRGQFVLVMLRLRPSEITLTPADVEETRRRMARRQTTVPTSSQFGRPSQHHRRHDQGLKVLRGAKRSRNDAITSLGKIPSLKPQKAEHSFDPDIKDGLPPYEDTREVVSNAEGPSSLSHLSPYPQNSTPAGETSTTPNRILQLDYEPAPTHRKAAGRLTSRENTEEEGSPSPTKHNYQLSNFGRERANPDELNEDHQSELPNLTDGMADLSLDLGTRSISISSRSRTYEPGEHVTHSSSPQQTVLTPQRYCPEQSGAMLDPTQSEATPTRYLRGYFVPPDGYNFQEYLIRGHTEPRPRPRRSALNLQRSASNGNISQVVPDLSRPPSPAEEDFWTAPTAGVASRPESDLPEPNDPDTTGAQDAHLNRRTGTRSQSISESLQARYRELFGRGWARHAAHISVASGTDADRQTSERTSEASSNSSLPYSFYELPRSRNSSNNQSQVIGHLLQSQYDGAASSSQLSQGAYYSIRPSQLRAAADRPLHPPPARVSSLSSLVLSTSISQLGISPLPASPYTRLSSSQNNYRPSIGLVTPNDFVGDDRDAASAAQRDLPSPLELLEQRADSYLSRISTTSRPDSSQPSSMAPPGYHPQAADPNETIFRGGGAGPGRMRHMSGSSRSARPRTGRRIPDLTGYLRTTQHLGHISADVSTSQRQRGGRTSGRTGQHSSENAPVDVSTNELRLTPTMAQRQVPRASVRPSRPVTTPPGGMIPGQELRVPPSPSRSSAQQGSTRDYPGQPQFQTPFGQGATSRSPLERGLSDDPTPSSHVLSHQDPPHGSGGYVPAFMSTRASRDQAHMGPLRGESRTLPRNPTRPMTTYHTFHDRSENFQERVHHLADEGSLTMPGPNRVTGVRRPPIARTATSRRRLPATQQNQENSGDAEIELMRDELLAIRCSSSTLVGDVGEAEDWMQL
ncbi:hypothetical protein CC78DRAFT_572701 [Lojkania enalia]|uniref:Uncharacterized protein n=1 Tax=Lojkania enalia TaxID=147567 RepID=A0A9P4JX77_9PLEO|nr:hypothetical protein CC78DRAFT_572701 [Didymosphaeria enalia]